MTRYGYGKETDQALDEAWQKLNREYLEIEREFQSFDYWSDDQYESIEHHLRNLVDEMREIEEEQTRRDNEGLS